MSPQLPTPRPPSPVDIIQAALMERGEGNWRAYAMACDIANRLVAAGCLTAPGYGRD